MRSTSPAGQGFTHRSHGDGTTTSVCNRCPLTVARTIDTADLAEFESRHVCQPVERRQVVRIVHRTYLPAKRVSERLGSSGLSQSAKVELVRAHLFLHPCSRCEKSVEHLSPNDERVCFRCQFSLKRRWKALAPAAQSLPRGADFRRHEIQLYSTEESFLDRFTRYIGSALRAGDAVVLVATYLHRGSLFQRLLADGVDVAAAIDQGRYFPFDAADTVSALMVDDSVDPVRFRKVAGDLLMTVKKAGRGSGPTFPLAENARPSCGGRERPARRSSSKHSGTRCPRRRVSTFCADTPGQAFTASKAARRCTDSWNSTLGFMPSERSCQVTLVSPRQANFCPDISVSDRILKDHDGFSPKLLSALPPIISLCPSSARAKPTMASRSMNMQ